MCLFSCISHAKPAQTRKNAKSLKFVAFALVLVCFGNDKNCIFDIRPRSRYWCVLHVSLSGDVFRFSYLPLHCRFSHLPLCRSTLNKLLWNAISTTSSQITVWSTLVIWTNVWPASQMVDHRYSNQGAMSGDWFFRDGLRRDGGQSSDLLGQIPAVIR